MVLVLFAVWTVSNLHLTYAETTKLIVAYASPAATFCPGWIAKREGIFSKYNLDVEMVLMQGASTYMPALASGNIQVLYGGGTAVSRAIATGGFDVVHLEETALLRWVASVFGQADLDAVARQNDRLMWRVVS